MGRLGFGAIPVAIALVLYAGTLTMPFWETDAHLLNLLSERALASPDLAGLDSTYGFIVHSPKGWADVGTFAAWLGIFSLAGPWVVPYRVVTLLLHVLVALALAEVVRGRGRSREQALVTACLFVAIPLAEEAVVVPAKLEYPLFACLALGAVLAFRRWTRGGGGAWLGGAAALTLGAAFTKELAVVLPVVVALEAMARAPARPHARTAPPSRWARVAAVLLIAALALPTFLRPLLLSAVPTGTATAPADQALGQDIAEYLSPSRFLPEATHEILRFGALPFSGEGDFARALPWHLALVGAVAAAGAAGRRRAGRADGTLLVSAAAWIAVGYGLVGFHLEPESFEQTSELYAAVIGFSILWGELLAGGERVGWIRRGAAGALLIAMGVHTLALHELSRAHAARVAAAADELERVVEELPEGAAVLVFGEGHLDRGAVDAAVLVAALGRDAPLPPIHLVNGTHGEVEPGPCPEGTLELLDPGDRALRWNEVTGRLAPLESPAARLEAMGWRNPDPEDSHAGVVCVPAEGGTQRVPVDLFRDLAPETILPRL